jgi:2-polyprenyl-3-methyl-5-hydroxy-6-metoxy-1,4-benzoquinol methylase
VNLFQQAFRDIAGGRVLDVATGDGGFISILQEHLGGYAGIIGIDHGERAVSAARSSFDYEDARFAQMDAGRLAFEDACFEIVTISASLHHLAAVPPVLAEMERVLKPGGQLIVAEMHSSGRTEPQLTAIYAHHWIAGIDSALGISHFATLARQDILDLVKDLSLCNVKLYDWSDTDSDPMDGEAVEHFEGLIDRYALRAEGLAGHRALKEWGEALRRKLREVGVQREPLLVIVGEKRLPELRSGGVSQTG